MGAGWEDVTPSPFSSDLSIEDQSLGLSKDRAGLCMQGEVKCWVWKLSVGGPYDLSLSNESVPLSLVPRNLECSPAPPPILHDYAIPPRMRNVCALGRPRI